MRKLELLDDTDRLSQKEIYRRNIKDQEILKRSTYPDTNLSQVPWRVTVVIVDLRKLPLNRLICQKRVVNCMRLIDDRKFHF
ncbi:hypothetical protein TNCT_272321 [Trichonephila clavata]|uniref:Uncharacterized protein n=1 Tax=Trichonephila clavata TaxID=2740835 RepID=A0A8X6GRL8_TRICU|nr:hypothetical protein TNCT_272321 [Trichonephila clavata]